MVYSPTIGVAAHTATQMGSGHFSGEGHGKASYVADIKVVAENNLVRVPNVVHHLVAKPACYDMTVKENIGSDLKYHLYYGGPGRNQNCP